MSDPVTRRHFVASLGVTVAATSPRPAAQPGRREALLSLKGGPGPGYVPAAFFLHFDERARFGRPRSRSTSSTSASRAWTS